VSPARILLVEDDAAQRRLVAGILRGAGYEVLEDGRAEDAERRLEGVDLVVSDFKLAGMDGMQLLAQVRREAPDVAFVMITAYGTIGHAVEAVRSGADDYLAKPFERDELLLAVERTLRARRLARENRRLADALAERERLVDLLGKAPSMQNVFRRLEKIAGTDVTVLLEGESGTGKELAARALHFSPRARAPFVAINCAAVPEGLVESEFFGARKGAFSGAHRSRAGHFEAARGGTLFLDEVAELPLALQPKLLRVLQERRVVPVGATEEIDVDVRIVGATHRDLEREVEAGRFREDLYWRLHVVPVRLPPLRERREDLPLLIEHFAAECARRHGVPRPRFPSELTRRLLDHPWPGNVRELGHTIERLVLLAEDGRARVADLPESLRSPGRGPDAFALPPEGLAWAEHERSCILQALEHARGNRSLAARLLGLPYKAFLYRLEKYEAQSKAGS